MIKNKNKNEVKLYNAIFPVFFLYVIHPLFIGGLIIGNFIIDSIVLLTCLKILYNKFDFKTYSKTIFSVVSFGFIGDIIGSLYLIYITFTDIVNMSMESIPAMLFIISGVILSAVIIFWLNYSVSFRKTDFTKKQKLFVSFTIAVSTAPYTFLIPTQYIYI